MNGVFLEKKTLPLVYSEVATFDCLSAQQNFLFEQKVWKLKKFKTKVISLPTPGPGVVRWLTKAKRVLSERVSSETEAEKKKTEKIAPGEFWGTLFFFF